ncbi:diphthine--ammonia ligase [Lachnospiraceae bacterium ZAX-1]
MKFAISYSSGKDSALALWRMVKEGHEPVCMLVTFNDEAKRSWFHGINLELLTAVSQNMAIPLIECHTSGENYHLGLEGGLRQAVKMGAESCVFGDIDIEEHLKWNEDRCANAGLKCIMPLWKESREVLVGEVLDAGFKAVVKCVESKWLGDEFLGKVLDMDLVERIRETGADICGENGEYHTFVFDGPTFHTPVNIRLGEIIDFDTHSVIDVRLK